MGIKMTPHGPIPPSGRMSRRLLIQYASDLHLEIRKNTVWSSILRPMAPVLALAGDIGNPRQPEYRDFLQWCSKQWEVVFLVAGNHEFYNTKGFYSWRHMPRQSLDTHQERLAACRAAVNDMPNVHFLQQKKVTWGGVTFLGATLWTDLQNPKDADVATSFMNDYRRIAVPDYMTPGDVQAVSTVETSEWHKEDKAWLTHEIAESETTGQPTVVITHHLPSFRLIAPQWANSPVNAAFASDCESLMRYPVRLWIAGHTHTSVQRTIKDVMVGVNPLGYPGESGTGYDSELVADILTSFIDTDERLPELVASAAMAMDAADVTGATETTSEDSDTVWLR